MHYLLIKKKIYFIKNRYMPDGKYAADALTIISCSISIIFFIIIFAKYFNRTNQYEYAWFCSKIYTIKKMVKENAYKIRIFNYFTEDGQIKGLETNYYDLLKISEPSGCLGKYKQCGILDTFEHKLCIDKDFPCPVNEIIADYASALDYYLSFGYNIRKVDYLTYNYKFYYTNDSIYGNAIVILKKTYFPPKYFDYDNVYFESEFVNDFFGVNNSDSDINLIMEQKKNKRRMEGLDIKSIVEIVGEIFSFLKDIINSLKEYIKDEKFEEFLEYVVEKIEESDTDIYYKPIGDNCYIKNFIGFDTFKDIETFLDINFDIYKKTFPDRLTAIFAIIGFILFLVIIIVCIYLWCSKASSESTIVSIGIFSLIHLAFFIGFMVSFSKIYKAYHNKEVKSKISTIKADEFITKFLKEFEEKLNSYHFVHCVIAFLTISIFLQIIAFGVSFS